MAAQGIPVAGSRTKLLGRSSVAEGTMAFHFAKPTGFSSKAGQATDHTTQSARNRLRNHPWPTASKGSNQDCRHRPQPYRCSPCVGDRKPSVVQVTLRAEEVVGTLDPAATTTYRYWTFNGKVPGPMTRVRVGDTVEVTLRNDAGSHRPTASIFMRLLAQEEAPHSLRPFRVNRKRSRSRRPLRDCSCITAAHR